MSYVTQLLFTAQTIDDTANAVFGPPSSVLSSDVGNDPSNYGAWVLEHDGLGDGAPAADVVELQALVLGTWFPVEDLQGNAARLTISEAIEVYEKYIKPFPRAENYRVQVITPPGAAETYTGAESSIHFLNR